jgi:hypothetical protein
MKIKDMKIKRIGKGDLEHNEDLKFVEENLIKIMKYMEKLLNNKNSSLDRIDNIIDALWTCILQAHLINNIREEMRNPYFNHRVSSFIEKLARVANELGLEINFFENKTIH